MEYIIIIASATNFFDDYIARTFEQIKYFKKTMNIFMIMTVNLIFFKN